MRHDVRQSTNCLEGQAGGDQVRLDRAGIQDSGCDLLVSCKCVHEEKYGHLQFAQKISGARSGGAVHRLMPGIRPKDA